MDRKASVQFKRVASQDVSMILFYNESIKVLICHLPVAFGVGACFIIPVLFKPNTTFFIHSLTVQKLNSGSFLTSRLKA